jgi:hypothetical protein
MDQRIFKMGLSVEAVSLYILLDSLSEAGTPLNRRACRTVWNAGPEELDRAASELLRRGIMEFGGEVSGQPAWRLVPAGDWPERSETPAGA